jgi:hypothetical protein
LCERENGCSDAVTVALGLRRALVRAGQLLQISTACAVGLESGHIRIPTPHIEIMIGLSDPRLVHFGRANLGHVSRALKDFGEVGEGWAEDGLEALWLEGVQHRLPLGEEPKRERRGRRVAVLEGFSLHPAGAGAADEA